MIRRRAAQSLTMETTDNGGSADMGLKAPSILTFMISVILVVIVIVGKFFGASIPFISGHEFIVLLVSYVVLALGCMLRGL